jgi:DNA-binding transcriptional MerR regulator
LAGGSVRGRTSGKISSMEDQLYSPLQDDPALRTGLYPIREVAERTRVNPVTLRAWERRYGLIKPKRTSKGHRLYSEHDIALIRKVIALLESGIPISQVRNALRVAESAAAENRPAYDAAELQAKELAEAALSLQAGVLDAAYQRSLRAYPTLLLIRQVIRPALEHLKRLQAREPTGAHALALLRAFLIPQIGYHLWQQSLRNKGARILLGALPGEAEGLEAWLMGFYLVDRGFRLLWLPEVTPLRYLDESAAVSQSSAIVLYANTPPSQRMLMHELPALVASVSVPVFAAGAGSAQQEGALRACGIEPLPLDEEAMVEKIQERIGSCAGL